MDPFFLPVAEPVDENVFDACRKWLRYIPEEQRSFPVKISQMRDVLVSSSERSGIYGGALREAQFYWAVKTLEPFLATAGMARKRFARSSHIIFFLHQNYAEEWDAWRRHNEERPFRMLLDYIAERMAEKLGSDIL